MNSNLSHAVLTKYRTKIYSPFMRAISDYELIEPNDKIAVCVSGGKDSFLMALCFQELVQHSKIPFSCVFLLMDPGYSKTDLDSIMENAKLLNIPLQVFSTHIFEIISKEKDNQCYLCAKMRRGALYQKASLLSCNKIALAHHFNDVIETTMMAILYDGEVETMLPKVASKNYSSLSLIRPFYYVREEEIIRFAEENNLSFLKQACFLTKDNARCSSSKRQVVKRMIKELKEDNDSIDKNIFRSMENVNLEKILGYRKDNKKVIIRKPRQK